MKTRLTAPFGSWNSPITSNLIVQGSVGLSQCTFDNDDIYWVELRPRESGRNVIVKWNPGGDAVDINPAPFNARTRAHEYGGGDYVAHNGTIYFSNYQDQRIYRTVANSYPEPVTAEADVRYADACVDSSRNRLICIREDHSGDGEAVNTIGAVSTDARDNPVKILVQGNDFYSSPKLSPDGTHLAWLTWNHPNMPWDGCELWVGEISAEGSLENARWIAGGAHESIFQPEWSPSGVLYFSSDRNGWWNLQRISDTGQIESVCPTKGELGMPQWLFGMSLYSFASEELIVCSHIEQGISRLALLDLTTQKLQEVDCPFTDIQYLRASKNYAIFRAGSPTDVAAIARLNLETKHIDTLRLSNNLEVYPSHFSIPRPVEFPTEAGLTAHGFFYPPQNPDYQAPENEKPPLIVKSHGGPTSSATTALALSIQFWTSRGFAVLDVNYGGSTGYGRQYRERLNNKWGIVDVDDCVNGARYLVRRGEVDPKRLIITGGSAGGYTTLCALTFRDVFKAGASHFGVSDAEALTKDTHKLESRYLDGLLGPYPEKRDVYLERSPINYTERLSCPVIFFQGLEDKVVPPSQAEKMVAALRSKGIRVSYVAFPGEQHGFRQAKNIKRALDAELYFYSRVFGFELAEEVEPVEIFKI